LDNLLLLEGDDLELDFTFHIRSNGRSIHLQAASAAEKSAWMDALWGCVETNRFNRDSFGDYKVRLSVGKNSCKRASRIRFSHGCLIECQTRMTLKTRPTQVSDLIAEDAEPP